MRYDFVESDTLPALLVTLNYRGTGLSVDVSGATVTLRFRIGEGGVTERTMQIVDPEEGIVRYVFQAGELTPGTLTYEVRAVFSGGGRLTTLDEKTLEVRAMV